VNLHHLPEVVVRISLFSMRINYVYCFRT